MHNNRQQPRARFGRIRMVRVLLPLVGVAAVLCVVELVLFTILREPGPALPLARKLYPLVSINEEGTAATWFSSGLWLVLGLLSAGLYLLGRPRRIPWLCMALVALYASADELIEIHEYFYKFAGGVADGMPLHATFAWVIPGLALALIIAGGLLRFVLGLPGPTKYGLLAAGGLFLLGAIGMEVLSGLLHGRHEALPYLALTYTISEEFLEMAAVGLAIASLASLFAYDPTQRAIKVIGQQA